VIHFWEEKYLRSGIGLDSFKMDNRNCRKSFRFVMNTIFSCNENPAFYPVFFFLHMNYRAMPDSTIYEVAVWGEGNVHVKAQSAIHQTRGVFF
jgi:hypothetical protein